MSNDSNELRETLPSTVNRREVGHYAPHIVPHVEATVAPPRNDSDLSLTELIALLAKRKKLIAAVTAGFFLFGLIYCLVTPSLYTSTTTLEMRGYSPLLAGVQSEMLYGNDSRKIEFQKTTVAKLKLDGIADSVLARDNLALDVKAYFDGRKSFIDRSLSKIKRIFADEGKQSIINEQDQHFVHKPNLISKYLSLLDINPVHETNLVEIAVTTGSQSLSQHIANAHAQGFIDYLSRERQEAISANVQLLERQADDVKARVQAAEKALADYAKENKLISLTENNENRVILRQMEQLAELLADATSKRVKSESILKELESKSPDDNNALDDEGIRSLRLQMKQTEAEYATLGSKATAEYPAMKDLRARIGALRSAILTERKRLTEGLRNQFKSEKDAEQKLRDQIESEKVRAQEGSRSMIQYNILQKEASSLRDLYTSVLKQVAETKISAASASSNVFVTDYASFPTSPSAPKTKLIMVLMTLLGALAGTALAVVLQFMDSSLKSSQDTQRSLDLPILGAVPSFSPEVRNERLPLLQRIAKMRLIDGGSPDAPSTGGVPTSPVSAPFEFSAESVGEAHHKELITVSAPQDYVSEALRTIRASILLSSADYPPKVIMVTSSKKGEGKTSIISNLAVTLAQAYHKTLVIDCDLRQSRLSRMFGQRSSDGPGLSDVLAGQATLGEAICETSIPALHLFRAGSRPPNPAELLGSQTMKFLISELSKEYEFILIDSPPVLPLADTLMLSRLVDSVVLVVRSHITEKPLALEARRRLLRVNARILGVVINDVPPKTAMEEFDLMYESYGEPPAAVG